MNDANPSYARILDELVIVLSLEADAEIPKTSKGSVIRPKALAAFAQIIDDAYRQPYVGGEKMDVRDEHRLPPLPQSEDDVRNYVKDVVCKVFWEQNFPDKTASPLKVLADKDDLFHAGIDSVGVMHIRSNLQKVQCVIDHRVYFLTSLMS